MRDRGPQQKHREREWQSRQTIFSRGARSDRKTHYDVRTWATLPYRFDCTSELSITFCNVHVHKAVAIEKRPEIRAPSELSATLPLTIRSGTKIEKSDGSDWRSSPATPERYERLRKLAKNPGVPISGVLGSGPSALIMVRMPFTLSHPAAAIPFLRTRLVPSALVIGCMVPDFEYFLRISPKGGFGHTLPGVFLFDLPVGFMALWLFHVYVKESIHTWLPESVQRRIQLGSPALPARNIAQLGLVLLSILVGVATHILWDSLTHRGFWLYKHWQFLHRTIQLPDDFQLEYLRVLQHTSTVVGAVVLLLWFRGWFRRAAPVQPVAAPYAQKNPRRALYVICIVALITAVLRALVVSGFSTPDSISGDKYVFERAVITAITTFWAGVVVYGVLRARARNAMQDA